MEESATKIETIDAYINRYDEDIQAILQEFRRVIKEEAPDATEKISYQMPTFYLNGNLVHFHQIFSIHYNLPHQNQFCTFYQTML